MTREWEILTVDEPSHAGTRSSLPHVGALAVPMVAELACAHFDG
jgi:hypothetical protein